VAFGEHLINLHAAHCHHSFTVRDSLRVANRPHQMLPAADAVHIDAMIFMFTIRSPWYLVVLRDLPSAAKFLGSKSNPRGNAVCGGSLVFCSSHRSNASEIEPTVKRYIAHFRMAFKKVPKSGWRAVMSKLCSGLQMSFAPVEREAGVNDSALFALGNLTAFLSSTTTGLLFMTMPGYSKEH